MLSEHMGQGITWPSDLSSQQGPVAKGWPGGLQEGSDGLGGDLEVRPL